MVSVWHNGAVLADEADHMTADEAERFARAMARWTPDSGGDASSDDTGSSLLRHLNIHDPRHLNVEELWAERKSRNDSKWMSFPIGIRRNGEVQNLIIRAKDKDGFGFHGLLPGTSGAGKSEMCLSAVYSLGLTHSPTTATVVYVDMKFDSAAQDLQGLPHVSAALSNLGADKRHLGERMRQVLLGELERRYTLFQSIGARDVNEYEEIRLTQEANGVYDLEPIPVLWIIADEYLALFRRYPKWEDLIMVVGEQGRGANMFFTLAGQRLDLTSLRKYEDNLGYRIAMRAESPSSSRDWCGSEAAFYLPSEEAGHALLKVGERDLVPFRCFYLSANFIVPKQEQHRSTVELTFEKPRPLTVAHQPVDGLDELLAAADPQEVPDEFLYHDSGRKKRVLDIIREQVIASKPRMSRRIWLDPLEIPEPVDELVRRWRGGKPWYEDYGNNPGLSLLAGMEDKAYQQKQEVHELAVSRDNVMVVGTSGTGKTTALITLVTSGCLLYKPNRVTFMCIGEGAMFTLTDWPHVAAVVNKDDTEGVKRILSTLEGIRRTRSLAFQQAKGMNIEQLRARKFDGAEGWTDPNDIFGDVFLVIDDFSAFQEKYDTAGYVDRVATLAEGGPGYGIHTMVSQADWIIGQKQSLKNSSNARIELKLSDPGRTETEDREKARHLADWNHPLFAITKRPAEGQPANELLIGVPELSDAVVAEDGQISAGERLDTAAAADVIARVAGTRKHFAVNRLPQRKPLADITASVPHEAGKWLVPFAIGESAMQPVCLDLDASPNCLAVGLKGCGKDVFLESVLESITSRFTPAEVVLTVIDPKRSLFDAMTHVASDFVRAYCYTPDDISTSLIELGRELRKRLAPSGLTPQQLRDWEGWTGPRHVVLINDEEMLGQVDKHLLPEGVWDLAQTETIADLMPRATEVGLHVLATRLTGNWDGVSMTRVFVKKMKDSKAPILFMDNIGEDTKIKDRIPAEHLPPGRGLFLHEGVIEGILVGFPDRKK